MVGVQEAPVVLMTIGMSAYPAGARKTRLRQVTRLRKFFAQYRYAALSDGPSEPDSSGCVWRTAL